VVDRHDLKALLVRILEYVAAGARARAAAGRTA
jgi:hypothetical protein